MGDNLAAITSTIWPLDSHTRAKHEILQRYLEAWIPILSQFGFPEFLYIDGFAGPGRYEGGEPGSPVIAIRAALASQSQIKARLEFHFIEEKPARADLLSQIVNSLPKPTNFDYRVYRGMSFEQVYPEIHSEHVKRIGGLPPTFAFIDPFGWGVPFSSIKQILSYQSCEVLITFMYEEINRFLALPEQELNFDDFFGTSTWRRSLELGSPVERNRFLHDLYVQQLRVSAGAKFVRSFQMRNHRDVVDYYLFFATNSIRGLERMKAAMWKVNESGEFEFSDATNPNQLVLFEAKPDFEQLKSQLVSRFSGQSPTVGAIEEFVLSGTPFRETHYKRQILRVMELAVPPEIEVINPKPGRKKGTFGDNNLRIRFLTH
jgi:three-Cys-motif partner protein